jgi:hypothetical protein
MAEKVVRTTYTTPAFRLSYPALFEPREVMGNATKKQYQATMLFPKAETVAALKNAGNKVTHLMAKDDLRGMYEEILKVARANFGPQVDLKTLKLTKFRDGDQPREQSGKVDDNEKGYIVVKTSTGEKNGRPQVLRADKTPIVDPGEAYAGCWCRAVLTIAPFHKPNRGVTIYLVGIQKLADDAAFSSRPRAEDVFDAVGAEGEEAAGSGPMPWEQQGSSRDL